MKALTPKQRAILEEIQAYIRSHKYPPTIREIAERFRMSVKGAYDHVKALERKQYLRCDGNRSRAIEILRDSAGTPEEQSITVPLLGAVAAGRPLFAEENMEGSISIPALRLSKGRYFALRVRGDSMREAGILEGDIAVVRHQNTADNGEIVVALVDEAVTLKRFFLEKNRVKLKSENPRYPPIYSQNVRILGRLGLLIRAYEG